MWARRQDGILVNPSTRLQRRREHQNGKNVFVDVSKLQVKSLDWLLGRILYLKLDPNPNQD